MKWSIEIQETSLECSNLEDLLTALGYKLIQGTSFHEMTADKLDSCRSAGEVFELAKTIREAFKGAANVDPEFALGSVVDHSCTPAKRHAFLEVDSIVQKQQVSSATLIVCPPKNLSAENVEAWKEKQAKTRYESKLEDQLSRLVPVLKHPEAEKILEFLSVSEPTGEVLYKAYELMVGPKSNRKDFHSRYGIEANDFNRFKDAVHNPDVSGDWARHAVGEKLNSDNPMTRHEAKSFVHRIAELWVKECARLP